MARIQWSTGKRVYKDSNDWLQNYIIAWFLAFFVPGGGTVIATLFIPPTVNYKLASLLGFLGGIAGLLLMVGTVYGTNAILVFKKQRDETKAELVQTSQEREELKKENQTLQSTVTQQMASITEIRRQCDEVSKLYEPIKELANIKSGDIIKEKDINVSLMFQQLKTDNLFNITFDHCILRGPCTVITRGNSNFNACNFGSNLPSRLIKCEIGKRYFGIGVFVHCTFNFCEFVNLSFLLSEDEIKKYLEGIVQT